MRATFRQSSVFRAAIAVLIVPVFGALAAGAFARQAEADRDATASERPDGDAPDASGEPADGQAAEVGDTAGEGELSATEGSETTVDAGVPLPREVAASFVDRTPLEAPGQSLTEALRHTFSLSLEQLDPAARRHADQRREVLSRASGEAIEAVSSTHDLMRFPDASRGRPVRFEGIVRDVTEVSLASGPVSVIGLSPSDAAGTIVMIMVPVTDEPPSVGDRIGTAGLFLKVAERPGMDDGATEPSYAVLVAAPQIQQLGDGDLLPDRSLWSVVQHRKLGVLPTESGLYYLLLHHAAEADPQALRQAAKEFADERRRLPQWKRLTADQPFPTFVDLFKDPAAYEGQVVTLSGYARTIRKYPAGENAFGIETLYETWIYTDDSQGNPAVIVSSAAPDDVPLGGDLQTPVRVTGFFFKIYGYEAHDTTRIAPMILASRIEVLPEAEIIGPPWWLLTIIAAVFVGLIAWLVVSYYGSRKRAPRLFQSNEHPNLSELE